VTPFAARWHPFARLPTHGGIILRRLIALTVVLLGACANHPVSCAFGWYHEDCRPGTTAYEEHNSRADSTDIHDDAKCKSDGLQEGTPAYAECRASFDNVRVARTRAALSALARMQGDQAQFLPVSGPVP